MGRGSYTSSDWSKLVQKKNITSTSKVENLYSNKKMPEKFNPKNVIFRESRDSVDNPLSTPIILGLDVTGSMGPLAEQIAKDSLNRTITEIYAKEPVTNPHIMFNGIGDSKSDIAPLQVTQFEADIRIVEQLLEIYFEGHGGGNGGESYHLAWYFAANHTDIDSFKKRGKKGYIITIGDEKTHAVLGKDEIKRVFDDDVEIDYTTASLASMASEKYELFHVVLNNKTAQIQRSFENWKSVLPGRVAIISPDDLGCLAEVFVSLLMLANGESKKNTVAKWTSPNTQRVVSQAIAEISLGNDSGSVISF